AIGNGAGRPVTATWATRARAGLLEPVAQAPPGRQGLLGDGASGSSVTAVVTLYLLDGRHRLVEVGHRQQPGTGRDDVAESGVLLDHWSTAGQVGPGPVAQPPRTGRYVALLAHAELAPRSGH